MSTDYNYDEKGQFFPYFVITLAGIVTVPLTYSLLAPSKDLESTAPRIKSNFQHQDSALLTAIRGRVKRRSRGTKRLILSVLGWLVITWMSYLIYTTTVETTNLWDPYTILGISRSSTEKQIKSHYRRLSLTNHPDKVQIDPASNTTEADVNAQWVQIVQAYKALTDAEVRENYQKYGHPEGRQAVSIGIALPKFIVSDGNGKYTLAFYLATLGVVLPYVLGKWWYGTQRRTRSGHFSTTAARLFVDYDESATEKDILPQIAMAGEFDDIIRPALPDPNIHAFEEVLRDDNYQYTPPDAIDTDLEKTLSTLPVDARKVLCLLWAHLHRIRLSNEAENRAKYEIVPAAVWVGSCYSSIAAMFTHHRSLYSSYKLSQHLIQAVPFNGSPLLQLPHMDAKIVRGIEDQLPHNNIRIQDFLRLSPEKRFDIAVNSGLLSDKELEEAESVASQMLEFRVERLFFKVDGAKFVSPNSFVQFVIKGRFVEPGAENLPEIDPKDLELADKPEPSAGGQTKEAEDTPKIQPPLVHAPCFAKDHSPRWHVHLYDVKDNRIVVPPTTFSTFDKPILDEATKKPTCEIQTLVIQFGAPPQTGSFPFLCSIVCDSYIGFDFEQTVSLEVRPPPVEETNQKTDADEDAENEGDDVDSEELDDESTDSPTDTETEDES